MAFLKNDAEKAIVKLKAELKEELRVDVYNDVAKRLIAETGRNQKAINDELVKRLDNWDIMLDAAVKKKVEEEEWATIQKTKP